MLVTVTYSESSSDIPVEDEGAPVMLAEAPPIPPEVDAEGVADMEDEAKLSSEM